MPRIAIRDIGRFGILPDPPPQELPPEAWSSGNNVVFRDNYAKLAAGDDTVATSCPVQPYKLFPVLTSTGVPRWVLCGLAKIYVMDNSSTPTYTNIVRAAGGDYTGTAANLWNGGWLNGIMIFNNGVDVPQLWNPAGSTVALLTNLTNWPSGWTAKVIRPFRNFLVALDVTKSSTRYPTLVSWSHPADPGSAPSSWDTSDATKLTGDFPLSQTPGHLVDCLALRDVNVVYKTDAIILQQYVGGQDVFAWRDVSLGTGLAAQDCVVEFKPGYHVLLTSDRDVVVCNGLTLESVLDGRLRREFGYYTSGMKHKLFHYPAQSEVWVCRGYDANSMTEAWIWNYKDNVWGKRYLQDMVDIAFGKFWLNSSGAVNDRLLSIRASSTSLYTLTMDTPLDFSPPEEAYLQRNGLALIGQARDGSPRVDYTKHKVVTEIWPMMEAAEGTEFTISIEGVDSALDLNSVMSGPNVQSFTYTHGTDQKVDCLVEGKFINIKFACGTDQTNWRLHGYSLEMNVVGEYV